MKCPYCGEERLREIGEQDDMMTWRCLNCGETFDDDEIEAIRDEFDVDAYSNKDISEDLGV